VDTAEIAKETASFQTEVGGIGCRPPLLKQTDYDEVIAVPEAEAFATARQAARAEGIFSGPSAGAAWSPR
jgi:cysteine synthase